jgi:hypothetical protein
LELKKFPQYLHPLHPNPTPYIFYTTTLFLLALVAFFTIREITLTSIWLEWFLAILTIGTISFILYKKTCTPTTTHNIVITTIAASGSWLLAAPYLATNIPSTLSAVIAALWGTAFLILPPTLFRNKNLTFSNQIWGASTAWGIWLINSSTYGIGSESASPTYTVILFAAIISISIYLLAWLPQPHRKPLAAWVAVFPAAIATWEYITQTLTWNTQQQPIEQWSIPLAILLTIAGYTWHKTSTNIYSPKISSSTLITIMPALLVAFIPTSLSIWEFLAPNNSIDWNKTFILLATSILLIFIGIRHKLGGLFYPGLAILIIVLPAILWIAQEPIPQWVSFAIIGAALIAIAARLEWVKNQYTHWAQTFNQLK